MQKKWIGIAVGVVALIAIVVASVSGGGESGEKVYAEKAARRDVQAVVSAPGQVDPRVKVNISGHVIGKIERLYFEEGDWVEKGQKLVDLEKVTFRAQADSMASVVANRRIDVQRARINLENAQRNWARAQSLSKQGILTEEMLDRARFEVDTARTALASAEEAVRQAEAGLRQAAEDVQRTTIVAPMSGRIVQKNAQEGEVVITGTMNNPGSVIAVLADLSEVLVEAEVGETEVVRVRVGQKARIRVDAIPDVEFPGAVVEIGSSATQRAGATAGIRYFKVKIAFDKPDERLRPGMTAQVEIVTETAQNALTVPVQSVVEKHPDVISGKRAADRRDADETLKKYVFVVREGKAEAVEVTTGISDATHVVIASGLKGDETVVTGPFRTLRNLRHGRPVHIESEEADQKKKEDESDDGEDS